MSSTQYSCGPLFIISGASSVVARHQQKEQGTTDKRHKWFNNNCGLKLQPADTSVNESSFIVILEPSFFLGSTSPSPSNSRTGVY